MRQRHEWWWRDVGVAAVAVSLDTVLFTGLSQEDDQIGWAGPQPGWLIVVAGASSVPVLAVRRRAPAAVCVVMALYAVTVTALLGSRPLTSLLVALYSAAVLCGRPTASACLGAVLGAHAVATAYEGSFPAVTPADIVLIGIVYLVLDLSTWGAGRWGAGAAARARARELEASRARLAQQAVADERLKIARELHDIVAHAITTMTLQAAGAERVVDADPRRARQAMESVEVLGRQAIVELRRLLAVLRAADDRTLPVTVDHRMDELPDLLRSFESGGLPVRFESRGAACDLDPSVNLTAYRVVQESLTNAAKHASGAPVAVVASWRSESVDLEVVSDMLDLDGAGRSTAEVPGGYGLIGLQERVRLVGGTLAAGPCDDGTFAVRASLPTSGAGPVGPGRRPVS
jgi:signal transduction histidine kinase